MRVNGRAVLATLVLVLVSVSAVTFSYATLYPSLATDALGNSGSAEIGLNVKEFIKLAVDTNNLALKDEDNNTIITPTTSGTLISGDVNLAVTTNTEKGYSLSVYTADNTKAMSHSNSGIEASIAPVDTAPGYNATNGISALANNTWGFRKLLDTNTNTGEKTYSNWYSIGSNSTNGTIIDSTDSDDSLYCDNLAYPLENTGCLPSSYNTYEVNFGAKLTNSLPAGTYANNVVFSAVAKSEGIKYRLIFNPNPTGANSPSSPSTPSSSNTVTGSMSPKTILAGSTTTLPKGTFEKEGKGIKGWALVDNATLSTTPIYDINSTVQVDTILADAETAGQTPDTNNNEINLYAVWDTAYTLEFQYGAEDVEGTPFTGTTIKSNNLTFPEYTAFSKEGYTQIGWALVENATAETTPLFEENQTISISNLITAAQNAGQSVSSTTAGKIVLYGVWEKDKEYMQDFSCSSLTTIGQIAEVVDSRDDTTYRVKKLQDGKCWMIDNLTLGSKGGVELTVDDTNIPVGSTTSGAAPDASGKYYLPAAGYQGQVNNSSAITSNANVMFSTTSDHLARVEYKAKNDTDNYYGIAMPENTAYYNFTAASLGYSYYTDNVSSGSSPRDICPKGWRLPKTTDNGQYNITSDITNDFYYLAHSYGDSGWSGSPSDYNYVNRGDTATWVGMVSGDSSDTNNGYAGFTPVGYYIDNTLYVGNEGYYHSSSVYNVYSGFVLGFFIPSSYSIYPNRSETKSNGFPVRCIAKDSYTINYDSNGGAGEMKPSKGYIGYDTTLPENTFTNNNLHFVGWSTDPSATSPAYADGATIPTDLTTSGSSITLYAIWAPVSGTMQNKSCSDLAIDSTSVLIDSRDNQAYPIYRFPNSNSYPTNLGGFCIMTKDLALGYTTGGSITAGSDLVLTDADSSGTATISASWSDSYYDPYYHNGPDFNYNSASKHSYYNWSAAQSVCPKGWRLPSQNEYANIANFIGSGATGAANIRKGPYNFNISGIYYSGGFSQVYEYGRYWSSTQYNSNNGYVLRFNETSLSATTSESTGYKPYGYPVRCIAQP